MTLTKLPVALRTLALTRPLLQEGPVRILLRLLDCTVQRSGTRRPEDTADCWGEYMASLLPYGLMLEKYLHNFLTHSVNACSRLALQGKSQPDDLTDLMEKELTILRYACTVSSDDIMNCGGSSGLARSMMPSWKTSDPDLAAWYTRMLKTVSVRGFGIFRDSYLFMLRGEDIVPVYDPNPQSLDQLYGYEWQREIILGNLRALVAGSPAVNMLLYGDSGTGKSSTIKAAAHSMREEGLRLIEVRPSQLHHIPAVLGTLATQPLRFIVFIDDLSFAEEDDNFRALKGTLEGSVLCRAANVIVCATSNRRKLIRESFSERGTDDDVHANETIQQQTALADRFGLAIPFMDPNRDTYLMIVAQTAKEENLQVPEELLFRGAERFALEKGGRTGRAARQYVELVKSRVIRL